MDASGTPAAIAAELRKIQREVAFINVELQRMELEGQGYAAIPGIRTAIKAIDTTCRYDLRTEVEDMVAKLAGGWEERGLRNRESAISVQSFMLFLEGDLEALATAIENLNKDPAAPALLKVLMFEAGGYIFKAYVSIKRMVEWLLGPRA